MKDIPPGILHQQCSDRYLADVSKRLKILKLLSPYLDITPAEEYSISKSASDYDEQKLALLFKWKEKKSISATCHALLKAIYSSDNVDLAHYACELLLQPHGQTGDEMGSTVAVIPSALVKYQEKLKSGYKAHKPVMVVEWPPPPALQYVKLALVAKEPVQRGDISADDIHDRICGNLEQDDTTEVVDIEQLLKSDLNERKVILFEGSSGSGKSTLLWHICLKWESGTQFQQFRLVLLVHLRDTAIHTAQCLGDILPHVSSRSLRSTQTRESIQSAIEEIQGEGVLIMLDGWDEAPARLRQKGSLFYDLIAAPSECSIEKAVIVVSSRSAAFQDMRVFLSSRSRVELRGFTQETREMYVKEALKNYPREAEKLIECMETSEYDDVMDLSHPMSVVILTHSFISSNFTLPSSPCRATITGLLSFLLRHIKKTSSDGNAVEILKSLDTLPQTTKDSFHKLCKIAYDGIVNEKYLFTSDELKDLLVTASPSMGHPPITTLGLLQSVHSLVATGSSTQYHFLHVSFQELCAAYHVVQLPNPEKTHNEALSVLMTHAIKPTENTEYDHFESVCEMYSALTHLQNMAVARQLKHTYCLYDACYPEEESHEPWYGDSEEDDYSGSDESDDTQSLGDYESNHDHYDTLREHVRHYSVIIGNAMYRFMSLLTFLMESQNAAFVDEVVGKSMRMWVEEDNDRVLSAVVNMASHLESVTCYGFSQRMGSALSDKQQLKDFVVYINDFIHFRAVLNVLKTCPKLKTLAIKILFSSSEVDAAATQLANGLQHLSLERCTIDAPHGIQDDGVAALVPALSNSYFVKIRCQQIGPHSLERLTHVFVQSSSLSYFEIHVQQYQGDDRILFGCLKRAVSLKALVLSSTDRGPSLSDTSVGRALLSGDLVELADILGLNTSPFVEKILDIHIFENAYIKVDFKNKYIVSVGAGKYENRYHHYTSYERKPKELKNTVGPDGMETLGKTLKEIPVKELNLCMHKIGDNGALYLGKAVGTTHLEELIIRDCGIGADGIASLFAGLTGNVRLVTLDASFNTFGDDGAIQLARFINQTSIQVLDISSCNMGEEGMVAIASALRTNTRLKKLSLYSPTPISQQSEVKLAKMLLQNSTLTVLAVNQPPSQPTFTFPLYYCSSYRRFKVCRMSTQALLTDTSTREFYQGIKVSSHISSVELDSTSALGQSLLSGSMEEAADILLVHQPPRGKGQVNIHTCGNTWEVDYRRECVTEKDEGLKRIRSIQSTPESWAQLTELNLKHQRLGGVGACLLAELLNQTQLHDLNVAGCGITEEGIEALASAISTNTTIKHLAIGGNQISAHGQKIFIEALSKNRTLVCLDIQTCEMLTHPRIILPDCKGSTLHFCYIITSFAEDEETFIRRIDEVSSLTKVVLDGCTPFGARLEKENIGNENDRTSLFWHSTTDYTLMHNTIECQLKPFQVTKICKKNVENYPGS